MFQTPFPSEQFGYSDRSTRELFTNKDTSDTRDSTSDTTKDTNVVGSLIQDNCVVESTDSRACGLRVKLLMDSDDPNNNKTGTVIKVSGTQFSVSLDNENTIVTVSADNIKPLYDITESQKESVKEIESKNKSRSESKQTLTIPQDSLLDLSVKQLGYRTIKVWNEMFQEIIQNTQNQDLDTAEKVITDINGERVELHDLEQWWMNPYHSLQHVISVLTRDDRLVFTGIFFVMLSFFCYFILVTN